MRRPAAASRRYPSARAPQPSAVGAAAPDDDPVTARSGTIERRRSVRPQRHPARWPVGRRRPGPSPHRRVVRPHAGVARAKPHVVAPTSFNQAQEVADKFKGNQPVIVNLQNVDRDLSRRLIDFASGLCYGLGGQMERVANQVFLLTPDQRRGRRGERRRLQERGYDGLSGSRPVGALASILCDSSSSWRCSCWWSTIVISWFSVQPGTAMESVARSLLHRHRARPGAAPRDCCPGRGSGAGALDLSPLWSWSCCRCSSRCSWACSSASVAVPMHRGGRDYHRPHGRLLQPRRHQEFRTSSGATTPTRSTTSSIRSRSGWASSSGSWSRRRTRRPRRHGGGGRARAGRGPAPAAAPAGEAQAEEIHRTLILAQRTADEEVRKATRGGRDAGAPRRASRPRPSGPRPRPRSARRRDEGRADLLVGDHRARAGARLAGHDVVVLERHLEEQRESSGRHRRAPALLDDPEASRSPPRPVSAPRPHHRPGPEPRRPGGRPGDPAGRRRWCGAAGQGRPHCALA